MSDNDDLYKKLERLSDLELIDMIHVNSTDYTEEALSIARRIISKRGGIKRIKENLKIQNEELENQQAEELEKSILIQETIDDIKSNIIKFKPSFVRIFFCLAATLFAFSKTFKGIGGLEDNAEVTGKLFAFFVVMYILWGSTFKLFPRSIKKFSIFNNQVFLYNAFGTERDVIVNIESVNLHSNDSFLTINGINKKNKNKSFEISKKEIGYENFELLKSKLENKIATDEINENEYECNNCGADLKEDDEICPKCGEDVSEIEEETIDYQRQKINWGSFNEPYCSESCYNDAGKKISSILLMGTPAQCGFCQKSLIISMGSNIVLFPYRNVTLYICDKCRKKAKKFVRDIDECCMCGRAI